MSESGKRRKGPLNLEWLRPVPRGTPRRRLLSEDVLPFLGRVLLRDGCFYGLERVWVIESWCRSQRYAWGAGVDSSRMAGFCWNCCSICC